MTARAGRCARPTACLERVAAEINELVEMDAATPAKRRVTLWVLLACRPWDTSMVHALRADADALKRNAA